MRFYKRKFTEKLCFDCFWTFGSDFVWMRSLNVSLSFVVVCCFISIYFQLTNTAMRRCIYTQQPYGDSSAVYLRAFSRNVSKTVASAGLLLMCVRKRWLDICREFYNFLRKCNKHFVNSVDIFSSNFERNNFYFRIFREVFSMRYIDRTLRG